MAEVKPWYSLNINELLEATLHHDGRVGSIDSHTLLTLLSERREEAIQSKLQDQYAMALAHLTQLTQPGPT